jgi:hypothetical protein
LSAKVAYFSFSRRLIVSDTQRRQEEGLERLREAREFAEWSRKDREAKLPPLTEEEQEQLRAYLRLVESHGMHMVAARRDNMAKGGRGDESPDGDCAGCPVLSQVGRKTRTSEVAPASA